MDLSDLGVEEEPLELVGETNVKHKHEDTHYNHRHICECVCVCVGGVVMMCCLTQYKVLRPHPLPRPLAVLYLIQA